MIRWTCSGVANQQWQIQRTQTPDVVLINNKNSGGALAVARGETNSDPGAGTGLVQDVDNTNYTDTWKLALTSYRLLTNQIIKPRERHHRRRSLHLHQRLPLPDGQHGHMEHRHQHVEQRPANRN